jgi:hypothetical protein
MVSPLMGGMRNPSDTYLLSSTKCRARLWRSEVEAAVTEVEGKHGPLSEHRRKRRALRMPTNIERKGRRLGLWRKCAADSLAVPDMGQVHSFDMSPSANYTTTMLSLNTFQTGRSQIEFTDFVAPKSLTCYLTL